MIEIVPYDPARWQGCNEVWNCVVEEGEAFPQKELLEKESGIAFFASQSYTGMALDRDTDEVVGIYILHPNNVGRCGHISNASYAVRKERRGQKIGELLVKDCLKKAKELQFGILQFNAVVASNVPALALYHKLGFTKLGVIPKGFQRKNGEYADIIPHFIELLDRGGTGKGSV